MESSIQPALKMAAAALSAPPRVILAVTLLGLLAVRLRNVGRRPKGYPPGPPTLPLIGNLHQVPKEQGHKQFQKWAEEYGPIYSLILGTRVVIVLSSDQAVKDLLDKRSAYYSSRPDLFMGQTIASGGLRIALMEYGDTWRMLRRISHNLLNPKTAKAYIPYQDLESKRLLIGLLDQPDDFINQIRRYTTSVITQLTFGWRISTVEDPRVNEIFVSLDKTSKIVGSTASGLLDLYPVLRHLPSFLLPPLRYAQESHVEEKALYVNHFQAVKQKIKAGEAMPSACVQIVENQAVEPALTDDHAAYLAGTLYDAGSDTSAGTLEAFMQAMALFPEVQKRAQEELDRVCGGRMPCAEDEPSLQYVRACTKEALRWVPAIIMGVPHASTREDEYMGYTIPRGATIIQNTWAIHMDPARYPNPRAFDPSRFTGAQLSQNAAEAAANPDVSTRDHFGFGSGRRLCPGLHVAERTVFLGIARMLWGFEIAAPEPGSEHADMAPVPHNLIDGMVTRPKPFFVRVSPRGGAERAATIRETWKRCCDEWLDGDLQWARVPDSLAGDAYKYA